MKERRIPANQWRKICTLSKKLKFGNEKRIFPPSPFCISTHADILIEKLFFNWIILSIYNEKSSVIAFKPTNNHTIGRFICRFKISGMHIFYIYHDICIFRNSYTHTDDDTLAFENLPFHLDVISILNEISTVSLYAI